MKLTDKEHQMLVGMTQEERFEFYDKKERELEKKIGKEALREFRIQQLSDELGESVESVKNQIENDPDGVYLKLKAKAAELRRKFEEEMGIPQPVYKSKRNEILNKFPGHDRIYLKSEDVVLLNNFFTEQCADKEGQLISFRPALTKGVVVCENESNPLFSVIFAFEYISESEVKIQTFTEITDDIHGSCVVRKGKVEDFKLVSREGLIIEDGLVEAYRESVEVDIAVLIRFLYFMSNHENEVVVHKQSVTRVKKAKSKGKSKKKSRTPVRLTRKVYRIATAAKQQSDKEKQERQWHIESFTRRGHWRTYKKSGKQVWIKQSVVNTTNKEKPEITPKEYRI